jgi:hypothetical protein
VEEIKFVEDAHGTARYIDFLNCDVMRTSRISSPMVGRRPFSVLALVDIPAIVVFFVLQVFGFVYS